MLGHLLPRAFLAEQGLPFQESAGVSFSADQHGRPCCVLPASLGLAFDFNISHDGAWVVGAFALSPGHTNETEPEEEEERVGVDVMTLRMPWDGPVSQLYEAMQPLMSRSEQLQYAGMAAENDQEGRLHHLLRLWTHKEAWSKAVGQGLRLNLAEHTVAFAAAAGPTPAVLMDGQGHTQAWRFSELTFGDAMLCAVSKGQIARDWQVKRRNAVDLVTMRIRTGHGQAPRD